MFDKQKYLDTINKDINFYLAYIDDMELRSNAFKLEKPSRYDSVLSYCNSMTYAYSILGHMIKIRNFLSFDFEPMDIHWGVIQDIQQVIIRLHTGEDSIYHQLKMELEQMNPNMYVREKD